jgi:transcriptional regulator with XRE-family HTH domain
LRGWSQRRVAEAIGTNEDTVSKWERGHNIPDPYYRERLCELFQKNADELGFIQQNRYQPDHLSPIITFATDIHQSLDETLDQAESIVTLAWEAWFASRPKHASREIAKLLPKLEKLLHSPLPKVV